MSMGNSSPESTKFDRAPPVIMRGRTGTRREERNRRKIKEKTESFNNNTYWPVFVVGRTAQKTDKVPEYRHTYIRAYCVNDDAYLL